MVLGSSTRFSKAGTSVRVICDLLARLFPVCIWKVVLRARRRMLCFEISPTTHDEVGYPLREDRDGPLGGFPQVLRINGIVFT